YLARYIGATVDGELANLYESGLDRERARAHAMRSVEACDLLMSGEAVRGLLRGVVELLYGRVAVPEAALQALLLPTWFDLSVLEVHNAVRMGRCAILLGTEGLLHQAVVEDVVRR